jgi:glycosyltransferase involved in cell wall biosynthesis
VRLLLVIPAYASYAVFLRELAETTASAGHPTAVACGGIPPEVQRASTGAVRLLPLELPRGSNAARHWMAARRLRRIMTDWRADVVHAHFSAGVFSTALALRRGDPWVSIGTFQGLSFPLVHGPKRALLQAAETFAARRFDRVHVLTADDFAALHHAVPSASVEVQRGYGFGCADRFVDRPCPSDEERSNLRRTLGIPAEAVVLSFIGRLVEFKGFDVAVRAFWRFKQVVPESRFVVLGAVDPLHPTGLTEGEWQRYQHDPDIMRVGVREDVMPWLDAADLMLFPTQREGMPVCVMEALARGLPVVTAPVRGCRELVVDGRNGFFVAGRTEREWAERLIDLAGPAARRKAQRDVDFCQRLRRSRWVGDTMNTYLEALAARDPLRSHRESAHSFSQS